MYSLRNFWKTYFTREREETKKEDSEVGSRKQGLPHEEEANHVQYDDERRDRDDGHAIGLKSCKSREEQEARGLGDEKNQVEEYILAV